MYPEQNCKGRVLGCFALHIHYDTPKLAWSYEQPMLELRRLRLQLQHQKTALTRLPRFSSPRVGKRCFCYCRVEDWITSPQIPSHLLETLRRAALHAERGGSHGSINKDGPVDTGSAAAHNTDSVSNSRQPHAHRPSIVAMSRTRKSFGRRMRNCNRHTIHRFAPQRVFGRRR